MQHLVAFLFQGVKLFSVFGQLGSEIADALVRLVLFGGVELLFGEGVVLVDGLLESG